MGWREKQLEKHRMHKLLEQVIKSPEYREERRKWEEQAVLQALLRFTFIGLVYMETNFHCKKNGFIKFLDFLKGTIDDIGNEDEDYFIASNKYYKENFNLDVAEYLGLGIEKNLE